jgi:imidazolonepropionase-like amidohydrolase
LCTTTLAVGSGDRTGTLQPGKYADTVAEDTAPEYSD